ncbi:hypothetical protein Ccrd_025102 [Cynara cardunculus var. scolymus]|uniref:Uncharacterized protein n=1 Tax=Cynara cardunculus var. scolymus TaxID=59895 RepID=A0A118JS86_CYNCS|nr:hypothetical protein Ccrd_025102 [Cynara cardunculus var. scolymus]
MEFPTINIMGVPGQWTKNAPSIYAISTSCTTSLSKGKMYHDMRIPDNCGVYSLRSIKANLPAKERNERRASFAVSRTDQIVDLLKRHEMEVSTLANLSSLTT